MVINIGELVDVKCKMEFLVPILLSFVVFTSTVVLVAVHISSKNDYMWRRDHILDLEKYMSTGGTIELTSKEQEVNKLILQYKYAELSNSHQNISNFLPLQHFFHAKSAIEKTKVFSIIKKIPKGASLHTHLQTAASVDYILNNLTFRDNIYGCFQNGKFRLKFFQKATQDFQCQWKELRTYRMENTSFDPWLKTQLSLELNNPMEKYSTIDEVWHSFQNIFSVIYDVLSYRPVFEDLVYRILEELYFDNVMYFEIRAQILSLYELNGTIHDTKNFFHIFSSTIAKFKRDYPKFLGMRYIHSVNRSVPLDKFKENINILIEVQKLYPNLIVGFDIVGYEEDGKRTVDFYEGLLKLTGLKLFLHAGETNWYGSTDLNLVDAILLNASRIGHGFGLIKHPVLLDKVKTEKIAIEVCPISNQVLMLNHDPRNHPAVYLIANGFPVVICNDDPSAWGATGLSYDWYVVFMAMTSMNSGIEVLKQFAMDSIVYSAMTTNEKLQALKQWNSEWDMFLDDMLVGG